MKYNLNKGLTEDLKKAFPNIVPIDRPNYIFKEIPNRFWISGFVSGDSSFCVSITKSNNKIGKRISLIFGTCLHIREKELLIGISNYFNNLEVLSGSYGSNNRSKYIYVSEVRKNCLFQIINFSYIINKIIPFFNKYPIIGVKNLDFADFKKVAELIKNKEHLTIEGIIKIDKIVKNMNLLREVFK